MDLEQEIAEAAEVLRELRDADTGFRVFGAQTHRYALRPPLPEAELARFEAAHGIRLPEDYRLFLRTVGDGGAGPYYGLEPLETAASHRKVGGHFPFVRPARVGPAEEEAGWRWSERSSSPYLVEEAVTQWLDADEPGTLEICHQGCAIYSYLVVTGPARGTIWDGCEDLWPLDKSFLRWYRWWADGALRRVRALPLVGRLRVGMTADEAMEAIPGAWKEAPTRDGLTTYFHPPAGVPVMLELDGDRRVVRIHTFDSV